MENPTREQLGRLESEVVARSGRTEAATLRIGPWSWELLGLDDDLHGVLQARWPLFLGDGTSASERVHLVWSDDLPWLPPAAPGELYRIEAGTGGERLPVVSYAFAAWEFEQGHVVALRREASEPIERRVENAMRWIVARRAVRAGGLAFHGAGWLYDGQARLLLGPSNAGKTTALSLAPEGESLGDDFALVIPGEQGWLTAATPFDNGEGRSSIAPHRALPVAGIWRLFQADAHRVEAPARLVAAASLLGCAALPWAMPDLAPSIARAAEAIVGDALYAHLHFAPDPGFWPLIGLGAPSGAADCGEP